MIEPRYFDIAIKSALHSHQSFLDCDIITQRWNWGWKFYCYMSHIGQVHLNLPDDQPGVAVVSDLVVLQHARRQGYGRSLLSDEELYSFDSNILFGDAYYTGIVRVEDVLFTSQAEYVLEDGHLSVRMRDPYKVAYDMVSEEIVKRTEYCYDDGTGRKRQSGADRFTGNC